MATATGNDCTQLDSALLERVNYFPRQLLTADDMTADQQYFIDKMRRHNRYLHGWGVVCGLTVTVAPTTASPWQVVISSGYALGPYGDEIYVPNPVTLDLAQCGPGAATDPCLPGSLLLTSVSKTGTTIYIAIRYEECYARPVKVMPGGCGCNDSSCEPSRISDSYEIDCLADLPPSAQGSPQAPAMCDIISGRAFSQCPPCPTDPWVVLASVQLPAAPGSAMAQGNIDNVTFRRKLFSTAMIQQQVELCCCSGSERAPARVTSINPANGVVFTNNSQIPNAILITFSKHLVAASVNTNTVLVLLTQPNLPSKAVQGQVTYDDGAQAATFTPAQPFTIPGNYQVTVVGSGPNFIADSDNLALDGNADGSPGGNFLSQFMVQIVQPSPTPTPTASPTPTPTPTPSPSPVTVSVSGPAQPPVIFRSAKAGATGDLLLSISGGAAGQKVTANATVFLSVNIGSASGADTAVWGSSQGTVNATKTGNSYTFTGVVVVLPGGGAPFQVKIANMKIDATGVGGAPAVNVMANISIVTSPGEPTLTPTPAQVQVAIVQAG